MCPARQTLHCNFSLPHRTPGTAPQTLGTEANSTAETNRLLFLIKGTFRKLGKHKWSERLKDWSKLIKRSARITASSNGRVCGDVTRPPKTIQITTTDKFYIKHCIYIILQGFEELRGDSIHLVILSIIKMMIWYTANITRITVFYWRFL